MGRPLSREQVSRATTLHAAWKHLSHVMGQHSCGVLCSCSYATTVRSSSLNLCVLPLSMSLHFDYDSFHGHKPEVSLGAYVNRSALANLVTRLQQLAVACSLHWMCCMLQVMRLSDFGMSFPGPSHRAL